MDAARWEQVKHIFSTVSEMPLEQHRSAVCSACLGDKDLEDEVFALLREDANERSLLDGDLASYAGFVFDSESIRSLVQRQIGPYRFLKLLGEGGMGVVYLAERTDIGGQVAVKLLRDAWLSPMRHERFLAEQRTLARMNHSSIAHIYDAGTMEDGTPWFVMEYADGTAITEYLRDHPVSLRETLLLFVSVCEAVQHAHGLAIIHRDLKPSNIFVTAKGQIKLLDFGIAKEMDLDAESAQRTLDGLRMMSPAYAAPEQHSGENIGVFTDIYALGVLLFEILTGKVPEPGVSSGRRSPPRPSLTGRSSSRFLGSLNRHRWSDLDLICLTALQPEPARRYLSVDALARDVQAFLNDRALEARPPSAVYTAGKFVRRNRAVLTSIFAVLVLFAITAALLLVRLSQAKSAALAETARTKRILTFTDSLFDGGDEATGPQYDLRVTDVLERGRTEAESIANDPRLQADLLDVLGTTYEKLGRIDQAESMLERALQERKQFLGTDDPDYGLSLAALGTLRKEQRRLGEAEVLFRQAIAVQQRVPALENGALERSFEELGSDLALRGDYRGAEAELRFALSEHRPKDGQNKQLAEDLTQLGEVQHYLGHYDEAQKLNEQALKINNALYGNKHPAVAENLNNLAALADNQGRYVEAEDRYRQALSIDEAWYGPDHPEVASALASLSEPMIGLKEYDQAESMLQRALEIERRTYGEQHSSVALTYNQLGNLAYMRNHEDEAEKDFRAALSIWRSVYGENHQFVGLAYANLAGVSMDRRNYPQAEEMCRKALAVYAVSVPDGNINTASVHVKLGRILMREGRFGDAEPESMAGYRYFRANATPTNGYLSASRKDLAEIEQKLGRPQASERFRNEIVQAQKTTHG